MMKKCKQLLDYLATHPNATVQFHASDMILSIHSYASYLYKANAHSHVCSHFFMGWQPDALKPIKLNGAFFAHVQFCASLSLLQQRLNLVPSSSIANRPLSFDLH